MTLLAHHFEPAFAPIYLGQFVLGVWAGWRLMAALLSKVAGDVRRP